MRRVRTLIVLVLALAVSLTALATLLASGLIEAGSEITDSSEGTSAVKPVVPVAPVAPPAQEGAHLYLVLDDAGHDLDHLRRFMRFPGAFTLAVLPHLPDSHRAARMAVAMGHEVILHQPMEAMGGADPGPGAVLTVHDDASIRATVRRNLSSVPGIVGFNNHMGSKATSDPRVMQAVLGAVSGTNVFFLDSRTIHTSVAAATARELGIPVVERDVFLDNVRTHEAIREQLAQGLARARERGSAVLIGHVTSAELADVLLEDYEEITAAGFRFLPLSDLVRRTYPGSIAALPAQP